MAQISDDESILHLSFDSLLINRLYVDNDIKTIGELSKLSLWELLNLKNITIFNVACIKKLLNKYNYHFLGEEYVDYSDYCDDNKKELLQKCERLLKQRNKIRGKAGIEAEEIVLCQEIMKVLTTVEDLRKNSVREATNENGLEMQK